MKILGYFECCLVSRFDKAVLGLILLASVAYSQINVSSFPAGCQTPVVSQFRGVTLVKNMEQPSEIDIAGDGRIFFTERGLGTVRIWDPKLHTANTEIEATTLAASFPQTNKQEFGMVSVALDPDFNSNQWVYIWHSPLLDKNGKTVNPRTDPNPILNRTYLVERFKMNGGKFDLTTRKVILEVPFAQETHNGGSMRFGPDGNMYLAIGDNAGAKAYGPNDWRSTSLFDGGMTTANTNDLRGKILRFKPIAFTDAQNPVPGVGTTYSIPKGNLKEEYASLYTAGDLAKIRPEIYTMGHRNPYRINVDENGWIIFGENGPGAPSTGPEGPNGFDEWNVAIKATNFGWPFFNGQDHPFRPWDMNAVEPMTNAAYDALPGAKPRNGYEMNAFYDPNNPVNFSPRNTGVLKLPPIKPALMGQPRSGTAAENKPYPSGLPAGLGYCTPLGGPIYRYHDYYNINGTSVAAASTVKFPPWFDGRWIIYDDVGARWQLAELDSTGTKVSKIYPSPITSRDFSGTDRVLDLEFGPDGALYLMNYGGGNEHSGNSNASIVRVEYTGPSGNSSSCYFPPQTYKNPAYLQEPPGVVKLIGRIGKEKSSSPVLLNPLMPIVFELNLGEKLEVFNLMGKKIWESSISEGTRRVNSREIFYAVKKSGNSEELLYSRVSL